MYTSTIPRNPTAGRQSHRIERGPGRARRSVATATAGLLSVCATAGAQTTILTNPSQFSGNEKIITFDTLSNSVVVNNQFEPFGKQGVRFTVNTGSNPITVTESNVRQFGPAGTRALANTGSPGNNVILTFNTEMNRVAFEIRPLSLADDLNLTLRCSCGGAPIATQLFVVGTAYRFVGLESVSAFDQVEIDVTNAATGAFRLDNLRFEGPPTCKIASVVHESSTFEPCPIGFSCATSIFDLQYLGSRFHLDRTVNVTAVGGHLSGTGFANQQIFAAIISLASPTALPIGNPFDPGELVATTTFDPGRPGSDVRTPLAATLAPGDYALVFGSGLFGATGDAGLEATGTPLPGNSILLWNDQGSGFVWQDVGQYGVRFVVEADTVFAEANGSASTALLSGAGSSNPEAGQTLSYSWTTTCPGVGFDFPNSATPTLTADTPGICPDGLACSVSLTVSDGVTSDSCSLPLRFDDTTAPDLSVPADVTLSCSGSTDPSNTGSATATDGYDAAPVLAYSDVSTPGGCAGEVTIDRTWSATDACANISDGHQMIAVVDGEDPTITCPANALGLQCPADLSVSARGSASASDNCGFVSVSSSDATTDGCGNTESIVRSWTATDACGRSASCDQSLSTVDTTPPVISVDTASITVTDADCSGAEGVSLPAGSANDACDGAVSVTNDAPTSFPAGETTVVTYSATDGCGNPASSAKSVTVRYGAEIEVVGGRHFVGQGSHPPCGKEPISGEEFCAYDRSNAGCAKTVCGGTSFQHYDCIVASCDPQNCCTTGADGRCTMDVPPGNYLVISQEVDAGWFPHRLAGTTSGTVHCGEHERVHVKQVVCASGRRYPCRTTRFLGSELLVAEPEFVVWDEPVQEYPFVLETVGDWGVTTTITPPEGFVADYPQLSAQVTDELEAVQFTVTEVGSDLVPTKTSFRIQHKGQVRTYRGQTGIKLTPDYARSRGFDPAVLKAKGILEERAPGRRPNAQD